MQEVSKERGRIKDFTSGYAVLDTPSLFCFWAIKAGKPPCGLPAHLHIEKRNQPKMNDRRQAQNGIAGRSAILQSVATHRAKLARPLDGGQKTEVFIYALSADENRAALAAFQPRKHSPVFLPLQMPLPSPAATVFLQQRRQSV